MYGEFVPAGENVTLRRLVRNTMVHAHPDIGHPLPIDYYQKHACFSTLQALAQPIFFANFFFNVSLISVCLPPSFLLFRKLFTKSFPENDDIWPSTACPSLAHAVNSNRSRTGGKKLTTQGRQACSSKCRIFPASCARIRGKCGFPRSPSSALLVRAKVRKNGPREVGEKVRQKFAKKRL